MLGGGGAKGAYQIGAINALHQYNLYDKITGFSGASIGALNMALVESTGIDSAMDIWMNKVSKIFFSDSVNIYEVMNMLKSIKSNTPLKKSYLCDREKLIELFDELKIENLSFSDKVMYADCVDITEIPKELRSIKAALGVYEKIPVGRISYFPINHKSKENIYKILLASSALPLVYEPVEINKRYYVDGGLIDNLPVKPLYDYGYRNIIIISCDNNTSLNEFKHKFPQSNLYLIKPSMDLGNLINGTLNFNRNKISHSIKLGYKDTMNLIKKQII